MAFKGSHGRRFVGRALVLTAIVGALAVGGCTTARNLNPFGQQQQPTAAPSVIGVNAYLWRASLDTLAFMPLASADPYGGIIITDWYANPEQPTERFKATVYILDTRLRADGLNVSIHRQVQGPGGAWQDAVSAPATEDAIENAILVRARQLRISGR